MGSQEWAAFAAAPLERWYRPPEGETGLPDLIAVRGADPEEYAASRPAGPALPAPPSPALGPSAPVPAAGGGLFAGICRGLGFRTPPAPAASAQTPARTAGARPSAVPSSPAASSVPSPAAPLGAEPPRPESSGFEAEEEIAPGQFYARKKPKFAPP